MKIGVIFACDEEGGIGINNNIPWYLPEDFKQFKDATLGRPMIMGRKTFDSLPGILPGRDHMVITSRPESLPEHEFVYSANGLDDAIRQYEGDTEFAWVIGGAVVIEHAIPRASVVRITHVRGTYKTDVKISKYYLDHVKANRMQRHTVMKTDEFEVVEYTL